MGTVVYAPSQRRETLGSDIGGIVGALIGSELMARGQRQAAERQRQYIEGLRSAPDRAAAMEVMSNFSPQFRTPQDLTTALRLVDEFHPASLETPTPVTGYSPETGEPKTVFPTRKQMADPKYFSGQNVTLEKPDMADFYRVAPPDPKDPAGVEKFSHVGKLPVNKRPEGTVTLPELTLARQGRAEGRAEYRLAQADQRMAAAEDRIGKALGKLGDEDARHGQATIKSAMSLAAISLNGRALPDGTWDFAGDQNKAEQFTKMAEYMATRAETNPKMLKTPTAVNKLFAEARRAVIGKPEDKPAAPPPPPKPKSLLDRILGDGEKKPESTMSQADKSASIRSAEAAIDRVRASDMTATEKKAAIADIRKKLADVGLETTH